MKPLNCIFKSIIIPNKNQENKKDLLLEEFNTQSITPIENILEKPRSALKKLSVIEQRALRYLFNLRFCKQIYPSQEKIAGKIGCSRKAVNEAITRLSKLGLIARHFRMMETCLYRISEVLLNPDKKWMNAMLAIALFTVGNLMSYPQKQKWTGRVTQIKYKCNLYDGDKYYTREEKRMNYRPQNPKLSTFDDYIPHYIKSQRIISLTQEQKAFLTAFPESAIIDSLNRIKMKKDADFRLLRFVVVKWCAEREITPNYRLYNELVERFNIPMYKSASSMNTQKTPKKEEFTQPISIKETIVSTTFPRQSYTPMPDIKSFYAKNEEARKYRVKQDLKYMGYSTYETPEEERIRLAKSE